MAATPQLSAWLTEIVQGRPLNLDTMAAVSEQDLESLYKLAFKYPLSYDATISWSPTSISKADFIEALQERILERPERALQLRLRLGLEVDLACPSLDLQLTLVVAISVGRLEVLDSLLLMYPDLSSEGCLQQGAMYAMAMGLPEVYRQLVARGSPSPPRPDCLELAVRGGCLELVMLFPAPELDQLQEEYLPVAAYSGSVPVMEYLLNLLGASTPDWNDLYLTSLANGRADLTQYLRSRAGLNGQQAAALHQEALSEAFEHDNTVAVSLLVSLGARVSAAELEELEPGSAVKLYRRLVSQ